MKIEKIDINKMDDLGIWLRSLTGKVNELVDAHNHTLTKIDAQDTTITTLVANGSNVSMLKCSSNKIECDGKANIDNLDISDEILKNIKLKGR